MQLHSSSPDTFEPNSSYRVQNGRCRISHQFLGGAVTGYKLEVGQQSNKGYLVLDEGKPPANAVSWSMSCEIDTLCFVLIMHHILRQNLPNANCRYGFFRASPSVPQRVGSNFSGSSKISASFIQVVDGICTIVPGLTVMLVPLKVYSFLQVLSR